MLEAMPGLASLQSSQQLAVFSLPEPVRTINIGICLCMLNITHVPRPVLQKAPSAIPKGFVNIKKLSLPTAFPAKKHRKQMKVELRKLGRRGIRERASEQDRAPCSQPPLPPTLWWSVRHLDMPSEHSFKTTGQSCPTFFVLLSLSPSAYHRA